MSVEVEDMSDGGLTSVFTVTIRLEIEIGEAATEETDSGADQEEELS